VGDGREFHSEKPLRKGPIRSEILIRRFQSSIRRLVSKVLSNGEVANDNEVLTSDTDHEGCRCAIQEPDNKRWILSDSGVPTMIDPNPLDVNISNPLQEVV